MCPVRAVPVVFVGFTNPAEIAFLSESFPKEEFPKVEFLDHEDGWCKKLNHIIGNPDNPRIILVFDCDELMHEAPAPSKFPDWHTVCVYATRRANLLKHHGLGFTSSHDVPSKIMEVFQRLGEQEKLAA